MNRKVSEGPPGAVAPVDLEINESATAVVVGHTTAVGLYTIEYGLFGVG